MEVVHGRNRLILLSETEVELPESCNAVLVRAWNRDSNGVAQFLTRMGMLRTIFPYDVLLVVIDGDKETGSTVQAFRDNPSELPLALISVYGPADVNNWTRMLNGGAKYLRMKGMKQGKLFCSSFETQFNEESLRAMMPITLRSTFPVPAISFRQTPNELLPSLASFNAFSSLQNMAMHALGLALDYVRGGDLILSVWHEVLVTLWRNTGMVWDFETLWRLGGFDPRCNASGGQEEIAHILRLALKRGANQYQLVQGGSGFRYSDPRLSVVSDADEQRRKIAAEISSVKSILNLYRSGDIDFQPDFDLS